MAVIGDRKGWPMNSQATRLKRGPLIRVRHPDGHYTKMYEADAIAQGLIPQPKVAPPPANKMGPPPENKAPAEPPPPDDFTTIAGVGKASARSLVTQGVTTFTALRAVDLDTLTLSKAVRSAIEEWRG